MGGFDGSLLRLCTFSQLFKKKQYPKLAQQWQTLADGDDTAARRRAG